MRQASLSIGIDHAHRRAWTAGSLAWALAVVSTLGAICALGIALRQAALSGDYRVIITHQTLTLFITIGFAVIGALVASHRPHNPIGWIFVAVGLLYALVALTAALYTFSSPSSPVHELATWLGSWLWIPAVMLPLTFVLLIFPDGHLPSARWRFVAGLLPLGWRRSPWE
jgi:hypothetical protein